MKKILLVEDEQDLALAIQFHLKQKGYSVCVAEDGLKAKQVLETTVFDMVLLDWMLPELSGIDILRWLRQESRNKNTYVLMVTAKCEPHNKEKGFGLGANDFLVKPFSLQDLTERVCQVF